MTVPGVGPNTAISLVAAIDELGRFGSAHALESYFGMTPGEASSSDTKQRTGLTKAGSKIVRWLVTQAAWGAWRSRPDDPMVQWARRVAERRGKKVAIMAMARKMVGIMFAMLRDKTPYDPAKGASRSPEPTPTKPSRRKTTAKQVLDEARELLDPNDMPRPTRRAPRATPRRTKTPMR